MSGFLNKVMLIGNLGKDPEVKTFEGGNSLARFPIATSESYTNRQTNEKMTSTEWHNIVLRRRLVEIAEKHLHKGDKVFIEGKIKTRSWEDNKGDRKYFTEVHADNMTMLGTVRKTDEENVGSTYSSSEPENPINLEKEEDDDLPF